MARSVYGYELCDPDFSWLITNFLDNNPNYFLVEQNALPLVFINSQPINNEPALLPTIKTGDTNLVSGKKL